MTDNAALEEIEARLAECDEAHRDVLTGGYGVRLLEICREQGEALEAIWPFLEEEDGQYTTKKYQAAINQVRSILRK